MLRYFFSCIIIIYVCLNTFPCVFCNTNYGIESIILADKSCNSIRFVGRKVSWQSLSHVRQHPSPSSIFVWTCEEGKKRDVKRQQHTQKQWENLRCSLSVLFPGALESNSVNSCSHCNMAAWRRLTAWHVRKKKPLEKANLEKVKAGRHHWTTRGSRGASLKCSELWEAVIRAGQPGWKIPEKGPKDTGLTGW